MPSALNRAAVRAVTKMFGFPHEREFVVVTLGGRT